MTPTCNTPTFLYALPFLHFGVGRLATDLMLDRRARGAAVVAVTCGWRGDLGDDPRLVAECADAGVLFEHVDLFARDAAAMRDAEARMYDVVRDYSPMLAHAFTAIAAAPVRGCPVVASAVGWAPQKAAWQRAMDVEILEPAATVTAVSRAVERELRDAGLVRPVDVIYNGVPIPPAAPPRATGPCTIGVVAHLLPRKGVDVLLRAFARLPADVRGLLRIAGTGEEAGPLHDLARELGIAAAIEWCGHVPVAEVLAGVDILAVPSRSDALPLVLLDGMAAGLPIVGTTVGGIPEALTPESGWLVPPDDPASLARAIEEILRNRGEAVARAQRARARATLRFSTSAMLNAYDRCYAATLEPSKEGRDALLPVL